MERYRLKPQVIILALAALFNDISSDMIYPLMPLFLTTLGATPLVVGMIEGTAEALSALLKLAAGSWSDRTRRRKPLVVAGYALAASSRLLIAFAAHWPAILTARLVDRTGKGLRSAPRDAMISDVTPPEHRGRAFGLHRALDHTGAVIGPLIAGVLLALFHLPLRTVFLLAVIPAVVGVAGLVFLLREERTEESAPARTYELGPLPRNLHAPFGSLALFYLANSSDVFLILQASAAGVPQAWIPFLWGAHHLIKSLFTTHAGAWSDRTDRRNLLILGWTLYAIVYLVFPFAKSLGFFLVLFMAYSVPFTLTEGVERAWIGGFVGKELQGKAFGMYYLVMGVSTLAGTALFGLLYQYGNPVLAFHTGAGLGLFAAGSLWVQKQEEKQPGK